MTRTSLALIGLLLTAASTAQAADPTEVVPIGAALDAPATFTVAPGSVAGPALDESDDWHWNFHGFIRAPMFASLGRNPAAGPTHGDLTVHAPPTTPDTKINSFTYTNNLPDALAAIYFQYGNKNAEMTIGFGSWGFPYQSQWTLGPAYLTLRAPNVLESPLSVNWNIGYFHNRYGTAGRYDTGAYDTYLFGFTSAYGETLVANLPVGPLTLQAEHGIGANGFGSASNATTLLHHAHLGVRYGELAHVAAHYLTSWIADERQSPPTGRITVIGVDGRFNGGVLGELYLGIADVKATTASTTGPVLFVLNSLGGQGLMDNYFGPGDAKDFGTQSVGSGEVRSVLAQYDYSLGTLINYPKPMPFDQPDIKVRLFGQYVQVVSDDYQFGRTKKVKAGGELTYNALSWFGAGFRYDRVVPDTSRPGQSFSVLSPRLFVRSRFVTHEEVALKYVQYVYGSQKPTAPNDDLTGPTLGSQTPIGRLPYDKSALWLGATAWW